MKTEETAPSGREGGCHVAAQLRMKGAPPPESDGAGTSSGSRGSDSDGGVDPGETRSDWTPPEEDGSWEICDAIKSMGTCSLDGSVDTVQTGPACATSCDPAPRYDRGPPFAVGDVIMADMEPDNRGVDLALAVVTGANHPHYTLEIEGNEHSVSSLDIPLLPGCSRARMKLQS